MRQRFSAFGKREKILIGILAALLLVTLSFYGVVQPFSRALEAAQYDYDTAASLSAKVTSKVEILEQPANYWSDKAGISAEKLVSESADGAGFVVGRIELQTDGNISVTIDSAKPTALFGWLARMEKRGIAVRELSVTPVNAATVRAQMELETAKRS